MNTGNVNHPEQSPNTGAPEEMAAIRSQDGQEPAERQKKLKKWKNWWYYYKWYVICGFLLLAIILNLAGSYLGWRRKSPDFQIAYIGTTLLPEDTVSALENAFAALAWDFNEDGEIIVHVSQYIDGLQTSDPDMSYYEYASEIALIGDIADCESYFFLMEDPEQFQRDYQLLAAPDGSCPGDTDYSVEDKVIPWADCRPLSEKDMGDYSLVLPEGRVSGDNQELLSGLYLGRRCFFTDAVTDYAGQCGALWEHLKGNPDKYQ